MNQCFLKKKMVIHMNFFKNIFYPDIYVRNIYVIPYEKLLNKGIDCLIFDIDNTLVPYDMPNATEKLVGFLNYLRAAGFKIALLSNNNKKRVELFNEQFKFHAIYDAKKPRLIGINRALELLETNNENTAIIGDQIFTDIWCGNLSGMLTILTKPVENRDTFGVFLKRGIERVIVRSFVKYAKKN